VCEKVRAEKPEQALENLRRQLSKTGGTGFECHGVVVELDTAYFVPASLINSLRRDALNALLEARSILRTLYGRALVCSDTPHPDRHLDYRANVLNSLAEQFYRRHGVVEIERAAESGLDMHERVVMTCRYCIRHQFGQCQGRGGRAENLLLRDSEGNTLRLEFDCQRCQMNVVLVGRGTGVRRGSG